MEGSLDRGQVVLIPLIYEYLPIHRKPPHKPLLHCPGRALEENIGRVMDGSPAAWVHCTVHVQTDRLYNGAKIRGEFDFTKKNQHNKGQYQSSF